jgi:hypothetical protein
LKFYKAATNIAPNSLKNKPLYKFYFNLGVKMTELLQKAFAQAFNLPDLQQNILAR